MSRSVLRTSSAALLAALAACVSGGGRSARGWSGRLPPPAGADSAAIEAWVTAQQGRCPGPVGRVYSEFAVADHAGQPFRVRRYFEGLECPRA